MAYRKKTLRKLPPEARKLGREINRLKSVEWTLARIMESVSSVEFERRALANGLATLTQPRPAALELETWLEFAPISV